MTLAQHDPPAIFTLPLSSACIGVNIACQDSLLQAIRTRLRDQVGFSVATLNLDHAVKLQESAEFRDAYHGQDFVVADGHPIVWLSRLGGRPVSLVTGSDLIDPLLALAAEEDVPVALFGSDPATLELVAARLTARGVGLRIVARMAPPMGFDPQGAEADAFIAELGRSGARLVLLALGAPRQEVFAVRCRDAIAGLGVVSVGAGLDFIAESQARAPLWMRRLALEWLWRLLTDPRRLGPRYVRCALVLPGLTARVVSERLSRSGAPGKRTTPTSRRPAPQCGPQPIPGRGAKLDETASGSLL